MWIKRLTNSTNAKWKNLSFYLIGIDKEYLQRKINFVTIEDYPKTNFYRDLLQIWYNFISYPPASLKELLKEPLYYNDTFKIGGVFISNNYLDWKHAGIESVNDLFNNDGTVLPKEELENKFNIKSSFLKYYQITSSIKSVLKTIPKKAVALKEKDNKIQKLCLSDLQKIKTQQVYHQFVQEVYQNPTSQNKWVEYYPFLDQCDWEKYTYFPQKLSRQQTFWGCNIKYCTGFSIVTISFSCGA